MGKKIIELEKHFNGAGEVSDYEYAQISSTVSAYLYEVRRNGMLVCFEVFERKNTPICIDFEKRIYSETEFKEVYPKTNAFGVWAWTYFKYEFALEKFNTL